MVILINNDTELNHLRGGLLNQLFLWLIKSIIEFIILSERVQLFWHFLDNFICEN